MNFRNLLAGLGASIMLAISAHAQTPALDDPSVAVNVMQFSAKNAAGKPELKKRLATMRDYIKKQPGFIENAFLENRNPDAKPHFVGVSRWKSFKDWETLWQKDEFQKLVRSIGEIGEGVPGSFSPIK